MFVSCQCLVPVSEDGGATTDAGIDAGVTCAVTLSGAAVGTLPCALVRWDQSDPSRFLFYLDSTGQDGRLVSIFGAPRTGAFVGSIDAPNELLLGTGNVVLSGPVGRPAFFFDVWNPMVPDAGARRDRGGGQVDLWLSDAGVTGTLDLRLETEPTDGGSPEVLRVFIVLP